MPTPNLYADTNAQLFESLPAELEQNEVQVIYVTDRAPETDPDGKLFYGFHRSMSLAYGNATVEFGKDLSWDELAGLSRQSAGVARREPTVTGTDESGRLPDTRSRNTVLDGKVVVKPEIAAVGEKNLEQFHEMLRERLAQTPSKNVYIYTHGYNVTFDQAVKDMAQLHHFMGREGVPIVYTWPAGHGGLLRGYNADRESSEFTVYHFKQFLTALAMCPEVESVNIIAHSRGTDMALTALRELYLYHQGRGDDTASALKLNNLVLAAPDLDFEVFQQRFGAERVINAVGYLTLYLSDTDRALELATWLFASIRRLGRLEVTDLTEDQRALMAELPNASVIDVRIKRNDFLGHGYFLMDPAVNSDLILLLRDGSRPGVELGRPLRDEGGGFWTLDDPKYPAVTN